MPNGVFRERLHHHFPILAQVLGSTFEEVMQNPLGSIGLRLLDLRRVQRSMDPDMVRLNPEEEPASVGWLER